MMKENVSRRQTQALGLGGAIWHDRCLEVEAIRISLLQTGTAEFTGAELTGVELGSEYQIPGAH